MAWHATTIRPVDEIPVLVVGAGPVGLTVGAELRRHGVQPRIIERLETPPQYAKAVGIQPRTLEVWEDMGVLPPILDAAAEFHGQIVFVNGAEVARLELALPPDVPFRFLGLPQYETERLLAEHLARLGGRVERGIELRSLVQDETGVDVTLAGPAGEETIRAQYVVGCDGAHSAVRHELGLGFEGDAFLEEYMLGDVEVDWSLPPGYGIRAMHQTDGATDDVLVCIPLPGHGRYRMSMLVPPELSGSKVEHGLASDRPPPTLAHIQAVVDRLAPERTTARNLRWSSIFRISHRLVERYSAGRVFLCGDAAHIHPPTGAQGMNTGIQDAYNLAWKLALAVNGLAAAGLLESYHAERYPVGEEVVGRTVRHAREGFGGESDDPATVLLREAQLLVGYPGSPIVSEIGGPLDGPTPGGRAPDVSGLTRDGVSFSGRLFELVRGPEHVLLLYAAAPANPAELEDVAAAARERAHGRLRAYAVLAPEVGAGGLALPVVRDGDTRFPGAYGAEGSSAYLIRPDGYLAHRQSGVGRDDIMQTLGRVFA
jgi:2-polyprenyl-6-methoxyphenol hydroxylase-like FAD-dependent oxidoreductase